MTSEEYKQLDILLGKLHSVVGGRFCIVPGIIQDLTHIGVYDHETGKLAKSGIGLDSEDAVQKIQRVTK
jgi:hypothetical protein